MKTTHNNHQVFKCFLFVAVFFLFVVSCRQRDNVSDGEVEAERAKWNKVLTNDSSATFKRDANSLLNATVENLSAGKALDLGMGQGRNSLFLARKGWEVTGIDVADQAIAYAMKKAESEGLKINAVVVPMERFNFGLENWDLIVHVYEGCLNEERVGKIAKGLKAGGLFVFEFFHIDGGKALGRKDLGCESGETKKMIEKNNAFELVSYSEELSVADFSLREVKVIKMVAKKK